MGQKYEEFKEKGLTPPYFYEIGKHGQHLFFLGTSHVHNPQDKQNEKIKEKWQKFLELTNKENCVALNEGQVRPNRGDETSAIEIDGEAGLVVYLARRDGVEVFSLEPDYGEEMGVLLNKFSREEVIYYYFARLVDQWHRFPNKPDFVQYLAPYFRRYKEVTEWTDFDFSVNHMIEIHNQTHDHPFDQEDKDCAYNDSHPGRNEVARESSTFRNKHIFSEIKRLWNKGKNIFIVYGSGHYIILEKAVKSLAD